MRVWPDMPSGEPENRLLHSRNYTDEKLLRELRRVAALVDKPVLTTTDFKKHSTIGPKTIGPRFGCWAAALERAGLGHLVLPKREYSTEQLLGELRRSAELVNKAVLTAEDLRAVAGITRETFIRRFGSWQKSLEAAGLAQMYSRKAENWSDICRWYLDEQLLEELRRVAGLVNAPLLTCREFGKHSCISHKTISRRFGDWVQALERAGLAHNASVDFKYSEEELLREVRRVGKLIGSKRVFTLEDFEAHSRIGYVTIQRRFGTWRNALELTGLAHKYLWGSR